jgi:hypothetical protein
MHGASEITPDKKIIWNYDAPKDSAQTTYFPQNAEIHVVSPAGSDRVLMAISMVPKSKIMIINTKTNMVEKEFWIPTLNKGPHLNFRRIHLTKTGTIIVAHMQESKVVEYDLTGKEIWSLNTNWPWSVVRLHNGNTLVTGNSDKGTYVREFNHKKDVVWELMEKDVPGYKLIQCDEASRLANGNTLIVNWCSLGVKDPKDWIKTVQAIEVTPDKKVVWALRSWGPEADLGVLSGIQLLDEPGNIEKLDYQR